MRIAHEVPLSLLEQSREFNDYDYALVHLFPAYDQYYQFFKESVKQGRHVLLDNSVFELDHPFDAEEFGRWIDRLQPTEYIIPDYLEDMEKTLLSFNECSKTYSSLNGKMIGVAQGSSLEEVEACFVELSQVADKVAISFDYSWFHTKATEDDLDHARMRGRQKLLTYLALKGLLSEQQPIHLLGCSLPQEFAFYRETGISRFIDTIDSSNPIVHGMKGVWYEPFGLTAKIKDKLAEMLEESMTLEQKAVILYNVSKFREFANGN